MKALGIPYIGKVEIEGEMVMGKGILTKERLKKAFNENWKRCAESKRSRCRDCGTFLREGTEAILCDRCIQAKESNDLRDALERICSKMENVAEALDRFRAANAGEIILIASVRTVIRDTITFGRGALAERKS